MFHSPVLILFYLLAAISIWLGIMSLRSGVRFVHYVQAELAKERASFTPFVTIFVPCRGLDAGLEHNIGSLFNQDYPAFEIVFVSDRADDPAFAVIDRARRSFSGQTGPLLQTVVAGAATDSGQKVHNLRVATKTADAKSEVFVFTDTDACTQKFWLQALVAPLEDKQIGATTGYRWFVAGGGGLAAQLQSVWNASIASALGASTEKNFCWGGSTAIRRELFDELKVCERWRGTLSDDFTITKVLHEKGLPIKFVPQCLTPSVDDCTIGKLFEFTTRQMKITRVYAPQLWKPVLIGSSLFVLTFFGGIVLTIGRAVAGLSFATPLVLLLNLFALGAVKSHLRLRVIGLIISDPRVTSMASTLAQVALWPITGALYLYNAIVAGLSRRIKWRDISYELKSPTETVILSHE